MKKVIFEKTKQSPAVYFFKYDNLLVIEGRSIPENPDIIYPGIKDWIDDHLLTCNELNIRIRLEYVNSGSSKYLFYIMKDISSKIKEGKTIVITWLYEEDDEGIFEMGKYIESVFGIPINIKMVV